MQNNKVNSINFKGLLKVNVIRKEPLKSYTTSILNTNNILSVDAVTKYSPHFKFPKIINAIITMTNNEKYEVPFFTGIKVKSFQHFCQKIKDANDAGYAEF